MQDVQPEKTNKDLQVENGNFTRIVNPLLDNLVKIPFKGCELAVAIYLIRKTYGFNKTQDEISLSQFCEQLGRSKQTIVTALKNLQLVNIARLVKRGDSRKSSNIWTINKYYLTWKLVNTARLVKRKRGTSLTEGQELVKTARHTKDNTKNNITKDKAAQTPLDPINHLINIFQTINPGINYGNKTNRDSAKWLLDKYGEEKAFSTAEFAVMCTGKPYAPTITTPYQLKENLGKLIAYYKRESQENKTTKNLKL